MIGLTSDEVIATAKAIAYDKHTGQKRWGGEPYITHPEAVASLVRHLGWQYEATAWLHDVLEDCDVTTDDLRAANIPEIVVGSVYVLTKGVDEEYLDYILTVKSDPIAKAVKIADIQHNLSDCAGMRGKNTIRAKWELALYILRECKNS